MKALLSTFGRRNAAPNTAEDHRHGLKSPSNDAQAATTAARYATTSSSDSFRNASFRPLDKRHSKHLPSANQISFRALDGAAQGIGDMPSPASHNNAAGKSTLTVGSHASGNHWSAKLSDTFKGSISRRKIRPAVAVQIDTENIDPQSDLKQAGVGSARHPPSSYRDPLTRSTNQGFDSPYPQDPLPLASDHVLASQPGHGPPSRRSNSFNKHLHPAKEHPTRQHLASLKHPPSASRTASINPFSADQAEVGASASRSLPSSSSAASHDTSPINNADKNNNNSRNNNNIDNSGQRRMSTMDSAELAAKLNELAVANADGLLSDDEYRVLRQAVFDRMLHLDSGSMQVPTATNLAGLGAAATRDAAHHLYARKSSDLHRPQKNDQNQHLSVSQSESKSSLGHGAGDRSGVASIRSGKSERSSAMENVTTFFRRGGVGANGLQKQHSQDSHQSNYSNAGEVESKSGPTRASLPRRHSEGVSSLLSSGDGHSLRPGSTRTHQSAAAVSNRASTFGRIRAGSQARRMQAEMAAKDMERSVSADRAARSLRAVSIHDADGTTIVEAGRASKADVSSMYGSVAPSSIRAEAAASTMFGTEYAERSTSEIKAEMAVVQGEGNRVLETFASLEDTLLVKYAKLDPVLLRKAIEEGQAAIPSACATSIWSADAPPPPSSYKSPRHNYGRRDSDNDSSSQPNSVSDTNGLSADVAAFRSELIDIYTKKAAVVKRYQDRLGFLQSKLRSAAIREGLK